MPTSGGGGGGSGGGLPQPGPLGYNIARRKPRQRWVAGFMGMSPGVPTTGMSALIARVVTSRHRGGRVAIHAAMPPGSPSAVALPPKVGHWSGRDRGQPSPRLGADASLAARAARRHTAPIAQSTVVEPRTAQAASDLARGVRGFPGRSARGRSDDRRPTHHGRGPIAPMRPGLDAGHPGIAAIPSCRPCVRWRRGRDGGPAGPHSWARRPRKPRRRP